MDNYIGRLLDDRYEILEMIGSGGMAVVYKARCNRLNRLVAIKILKEELSKDEEFRRRFHAESQAVAMMSHPNIVSVYDVSHSENVDYIVMELIDGITLKQYMEQKQVLNWREALHFATQIAKALEHAHSRGIIHRDIKPHNIMVLKDGSVKVADFGIAQMASAQSTLTREALGSVHYISPEQAKGAHVDARTDLYSLGVVMYEMLTGRPPFDGDTPVSVAIQHINAKAVPPRQLNPSIPVGLEQITMHAMTADRDKRYSSATEMLEDLEKFRRDPNMTFDFTAPRDGMDFAQLLNTPDRPQRQETERPQRQPRTEPVKMPEKREKEGSSEARKSSRIAVTAGIVCIVLAILGIVYFLYNYFVSDLFTKTEEDVVPTLIGANYDELKLSNYPNFKIEIQEWRASDEYAYGYILDQSPAPGRTVKVGSTVGLIVSSGAEEKKMPDLVNMTLQNALTSLNTMSIPVTANPIYEESDVVTDGYVIRTEPAKDEPLTEGQVVNLYVSLGTAAELVRVPSLVGMTVEAAKALIEAKGLSVGSATAVESDLPEGTVTFQSIDPDEEVRRETVINLQISKGPADAETPAIISQSTDTTVTRGETLTLEVEAQSTDDGVLSYAWYQTPSGSTDDGVLVGSRAACSVSTETPGTYYYFCKVVNTVGDETSFAYSEMICVTVTEAAVTDVILHVQMPSGDGIYEVYVMVGGEIQIEPFEVDMSKNIGRDLELPVKGSGIKLVTIFVDGEEYDTQLVDFDAEGY